MRVIQTERLHPECAAWLAERVELIVSAPGEEAFERAIAGAHGLVVRTYTRVDGALLDRAPLLRVVGRAGVGLDNIDLRACAERGIEVVHTPDANTQAVAEYVFAMLFDALRPRQVLDDAVDLETWRGLRRRLAAPRQLSDMVLGVYGFGRVGRRVAAIAQGFGMRVLFHDLLDIPVAERGSARPVDRDTLLREADIVTVHVDGRPSNRGLLDGDAFDLMRGDAILVNTSRGFVVEAAALAGWLVANPDARAILDVHEPEPFGSDYPLLKLPNAGLTPHIGAATETADRNMSRVVEAVWQVLQRDTVPGRKG